MIFTPSYSTTMNTIPKEKAGVAFGTLSTLRNIASCVGVAAFGTLIETLQSFDFFHKLNQNPSTEKIPYLTAKNIFYQKIDPSTIFPPSLTDLIETFLYESKIFAFSFSHFIVAICLIGAFALVFTLFHRKSTHHLPETPAEGWD